MKEPLSNEMSSELLTLYALLFFTWQSSAMAALLFLQLRYLWLAAASFAIFAISALSFVIDERRSAREDSHT